MKNIFNNKAPVETYKINSLKKAFSCSFVSILCWSFWHAINLFLEYAGELRIFVLRRKCMPLIWLFITNTLGK
jgi:hypothetical protein